MDRIDVVVVDDHPIYRDGLVAGLSTQADFRVVGEFASVEELDARVVVRPRVAVVDLGLPGVRGRHAVAHVRAAHECGVLVVSSAGFRSSVLAAMAAGARGYLTKQATSEELFRAVRCVSRGRYWISAGLADFLRAAVRDPDGPGVELGADQEGVLELLARGETPEDVAEALDVPKGRVLLWAQEAVEAACLKAGAGAAPASLAALSPRQREVLALVAEGCTDEEIAAAMGIGVSSVRNHLDRIRAKTGHRRRADLAVFATLDGGTAKLFRGDVPVRR